MAQAWQGNDFVFNVPDGWVERTTVGFSAPPSPERPVTPNILVSVGRMAPEETLAAFVDRQVDELRGHAHGFQLTSRRDARLDREACIEIVFSWDEGYGPIRQRQVYARRPGERIIGVMHTAREADFAGCDGVFNEMLRDFAWVEPEAPTPAPRP